MVDRSAQKLDVLEELESAPAIKRFRAACAPLAKPSPKNRFRLDLARKLARGASVARPGEYREVTFHAEGLPRLEPIEHRRGPRALDRTRATRARRGAQFVGDLPDVARVAPEVGQRFFGGAASLALRAALTADGRA